jgi:hypothetical protein
MVQSLRWKKMFRNMLSSVDTLMSRAVQETTMPAHGEPLRSAMQSNGEKRAERKCRHGSDCVYLGGCMEKVVGYAE